MTEDDLRRAELALRERISVALIAMRNVSVAPQSTTPPPSPSRTPPPPSPSRTPPPSRPSSPQTAPPPVPMPTAPIAVRRNDYNGLWIVLLIGSLLFNAVLGMMVSSAKNQSADASSDLNSALTAKKAAEDENSVLKAQRAAEVALQETRDKLEASKQTALSEKPTGIRNNTDHDLHIKLAFCVSHDKKGALTIDRLGGDHTVEVGQVFFLGRACGAFVVDWTDNNNEQETSGYQVCGDLSPCVLTAYR